MPNLSVKQKLKLLSTIGEGKLKVNFSETPRISSRKENADENV